VRPRQTDPAPGARSHVDGVRLALEPAEITEALLLRLLKRRFGWTALGPNKLYKTRWLAEAAEVWSDRMGAA
jgi:hypothetical protein